MHKERIVICGGGMAALTTAFELTEQPGWKQRYDITVYQSGWLLGGKGASVRNRAKHDRVEEHGLHIWMGSYHNAFSVVRRAYDDLARKDSQPLSTWSEAFMPQDFVVLEEETASGWRHWKLELPRNRGTPGSHLLRAKKSGKAPKASDVGTSDYVRMALDWLIQVLVHWGETDNASYKGREIHWKEAIASLRVLPTAVRAGAATTGAWIRKLANTLGADLQRDFAHDLNARWTWFSIDFITTHIVGLLRDGLVGEDADFNTLDDEDYRAWLLRHGASQETLDAPPVRALYTLMFSHHDGVAASFAVRAMLRMMVGYKGAVFYRMTAGMGETIFAPLYEILHKRGVRFEFFHQLTRMEISDDGRDIGLLRFGVQATSKNEYQPLVHIDGLPCWPETPLWEQLEEGAALAEQTAAWAYPNGPCVRETELLLGRDFDKVVLGIPVSALAPICAPLMQRDAAWQEMVENLRSIPTHALQLWFKKNLAELGWSMPSPILGTYAEPLDTWCDMTHLLDVERWPDAQAPKNVAYFCGQFRDSAMQAPESVAGTAALRDESETLQRQWLDQRLAHLLPKACKKDGGFDWSGLVEDGVYFRTNVAPSDRYILSVPGTGRFRMAPHDTGFANLVVCGDWTKTGMDAGCIESATMSGRQAARAVDHVQREIPGEPKTYRERFEKHTLRPLFVERDYDMMHAGPYQSSGCDMHSFFLRADMKALRRLVDRVLNEPSGGAVHYVPAAPFVILGCAFIDEVRPAPPVGRTSEIDLAFWVPLIATRNRARPSLVWFLPWVLVDSPAATAVGREIYGFPKLTCDFRHERDDRGLASLDVRGHALERFDAGSWCEPKSLVRITRREKPAALENDWRTRLGLDQNLLSRFGASMLGLAQLGLDNAVLRPGAAALGTALPMVFLRQFRDVRDPRYAAYQAIIEAPARLTGYRGTQWSGDTHDIEITSHASLPMLTDLGLTSATPRAILSSRSDFDFRLEHGRELWRA